MNIVASHPTSRGGGAMMLQSVSGVAHISVGETVIDILVVEGSIEGLRNLRIEGVDLTDGEIWFEDIREQSH